MASLDNWPRVIVNETEACGVFNTSLPSIFKFEPNKPYIIYCPSDRWGKTVSKERLLVCHSRHLDVYTYDQALKKIHKATHVYNEFDLIERKRALLFSQVRISSGSTQAHSQSVIEYNSVSQALFDPIIQRFRSCIQEPPMFYQEHVQSVIDHLDYRFTNILKELNFDAHNLMAIFHQAELTEPFLLFFKRTLNMPSLTLIRSNELIRIDLGARLKWGKSHHEESYIYLPLERIKSAHIQEFYNPVPSTTLHIEVRSGMSIDFSFITDSKNHFSHPLSELLKLINT